MDQICLSEKLCTGCAACYNACPVSAISMQPDTKGFLYPVINQEKCIDCGLCQKTCPQIDRRKPCQEGVLFAAIAIDDNLRKKSSSGGVFSLLAEQVIRTGGVVFGAALNQNNQVQHTFADNLAALSRLRGSKYVQSEIGRTYTKTKELLDEDIYVLFSGTPCQISGLRRFLNK